MTDLNNHLSRIHAVRASGPSTLDVSWPGGSIERIELAEWIAGGGEVLASLSDPAVFETARVGDFGASVEWGDNQELAIDVLHLSLIAAEQRAMRNTVRNIREE